MTGVPPTSGVPPMDSFPQANKALLRPAAAPALERFRARLPLPAGEPFVTAGEGDTPLVPGASLGKAEGMESLFFKCEHASPSGSYKDRFAAVQVSVMRARGVRSFLATSSGNTGAALAAYAARAGLRCALFVNELTPDGKLTQVLGHGARVYRVKGFGKVQETTAEVFERLKARSERSGEPLVVSAYAYSPDGMEGVKTIAYEIAEQLSVPPDDVFVPVGGGGLLTAVARGFQELEEAGILPKSPRIHAVQPRLNDTIVTPLREGRDQARSVSTTTRISGLAVPVDIDGSRAIAAVRRSGGTGFAVEDEDVWEAQARLLRSEGLYVEPAGAASVAGAIKARREGALARDAVVVCVLTGHGFKDAAAVERLIGTRGAVEIEPDAIDGLEI